MDQLDRAITLAVERHGHQRDKSGSKYILHPLRVMNAVYHLGEEFACVGVLHDVIEDTFLTREEGLRFLSMPYHQLNGIMDRYFNDRVVQGVAAVSRLGVHGAWTETYMEFIARAIQDPIGRYVKIADIVDNMDRLQTIIDEDERYGMERRYRKALIYITSEFPGLKYMTRSVLLPARQPDSQSGKERAALSPTTTDL